jgi:hypothetical protein
LDCPLADVKHSVNKNNANLAVSHDSPAVSPPAKSSPSLSLTARIESIIRRIASALVPSALAPRSTPTREFVGSSRAHSDASNNASRAVYSHNQITSSQSITSHHIDANAVKKG